MTRLLFWRRLSAAHLNGIMVALGVALVQITVFSLLGMDASIQAVVGAVCTSLPDVPNPPQRIWPRVLPAALISALVTLLVGLARTPAAMCVVIVVVTFVSLMTQAWGPRAAMLSFSGVLALIFGLASEPPPATPAAALQGAAWLLCGALLYTLWARVACELLQPRYRQLALAAALRASARRLRSRALRVSGEIAGNEDGIRLSIVDDQQLAEALQTARDQIFAARQTPVVRRQIDVLLGLIELRDAMLAIRLDMPLLDDDDTGRGWRAALAATIMQLAAGLQALTESVAEGAPLPRLSAAAWQHGLSERLAAVPVAPGDARRHLLGALQVRVGHMLNDVAAMAERLDGPDRECEWSRGQLQHFVSPEGWPLAALKPHLSLQSGVFRHALRSALAFCSAYLLGFALPWGSHGYWLVLSVAVVLRGNLEQTLSRRNDRIAGTVIGCLLVLAFAHLKTPPPLLLLAFFAAVGVAHAYVNVRYKVAASAASLMALLPTLLLAPGSPPAVGVRLADTVIGALLAWAFSFVLPAWERGSQRRLTEQLRAALARHASNVLRWAPTPEQGLAQRLSRQQAYVALGTLATAAQRSLVEPKSVRLPEHEVESVLDHAYRLMALLSAVQQMLSRRTDWLHPERTAAELAEAREACMQRLSADIAPAESAPEADPEARYDADLAWPPHLGQQDLTPWIERRLQRCQREAARLTEAVGGLLVAIDAGR